MSFARTAVNTTGNFTSGSTSITGVASTTGMFIGMMVYGPQVRPNTVITNIVGTTVTMDKTALGTATAAALTGQYIIQSGTDANPAGLAAMTGVTTLTGNATNRRVVMDLGVNQLRFQGTLTHDPDEYEIIGNVRNGLSFESGSNVTFGIERTVNGRKTYSKGTGLVSTYVGDFFTLFGVTFSGGTFNWYGGVLQTFGPIAHSNNVFTTFSFDCVWRLSAISCQFRSTGTPTFNALTVQGIGVDAVFFLAGGWNAFTINYERVYYQTPAGGGSNRTVLNPVFANNQAEADLRANQASGTQQVTTIKNPDVFPRLAKLSSNAYADFPVVEAVSLSVTNSANAAVGANEVVAYIRDTNNGARLNSQVTNYVNDRTYIAASAASGAINLGDVLTLVGVNPDVTTGTINLDYRSNFGNGSADFNIYLGGYSYNPTVTRETLLGNNGINVKWTMFDDANVTLSRTAALALVGTKFAINPATQTVTVLANANYDELYDATKAFKYNGTAANFETPVRDSLIVTPTGSNLQAYAGWTLVVNTGVTFGAGTKFGFVKFGTVTINGTGKISGLYASSVGGNTVLDVRAIKAGASYIVANNDTKATILFGVNNTGTAQDYQVSFPPGSAGSQVYVARKTHTDQFDFAVLTLVEGGMFVGFNDIPDEGITQTNLATVQAYTSIETTSKLYDYISAYQTTEAGIKLGNIVTRAGPLLQFGNYSGVINQSAASVFGITGDTITIKATGLAKTSRYTTIIATPPAAWTANTNEVLDLDIEDANGNSSVTIQASNVSTFEVWKLADGVPEDQYATGTLLDTVGPGKFRFLHADGYKLVIRDQVTNYRVTVEAEKGIYEAAMFFGPQVQLAQSALVEVIKTDVDLLKVLTQAIQGAGFLSSIHSLAALSGKVDALPQAGDIVDANIVKVNGVTVDGTGSESDPWGPV